MKKIDDILNKFPDGIERFQNDAIFNRVVKALARIEDENHTYALINDLLDLIKNQQKEISKLLENKLPGKIEIIKDETHNWDNFYLTFMGMPIDEKPIKYKRHLDIFDLELQITVALLAEDYELCAQIKKQINTLKNNENNL